MDYQIFVKAATGRHSSHKALFIHNFTPSSSQPSRNSFGGQAVKTEGAAFNIEVIEIKSRNLMRKKEFSFVYDSGARP